MTSPVSHRLLVTHRLCLRVLLPILMLCLSVATGGCVSRGTNPVSGNTRAFGYSWEEEQKLGKEADQQIQQQYGVYEDEDLEQYVDDLGQELLAESHLRRSDTPERFRETEFEFRVLDSPIINAFALPGGYVYVTRGLVAHLNNEAQLSVVLGHEIAHVAARHASQQAGRQQLTQGLLLGGALAGGIAFGGDVAEQVIGLGGTAAQLLSLRYSRDNERESDQLGVEYAVRAGFEGSEGAAFFTTLERIREQQDQTLPTWQSTHPDPGEREQNIPQIAEEWKEKLDQQATTVNQDEYYDTIEGIILGQNPRQGFTEDEVFYHPDLEFQFSIPRGWNVQNQPRQVAVIQPDQEAYLVFQFADANTPEEAARKFAGQEGLKVVEDQRGDIRGYEAQRVLAEGQTQQGQTVRVLAYFIEYGDNVYQFQGITSAEEYSSYRGTFEQSITSFDQLTDESKLNVQPTNLEIQSAPRSASFRSFVDEDDLSRDMTVEDLAIINQVEVEQTVEEGRPLKLPE